MDGTPSRTRGRKALPVAAPRPTPNTQPAKVLRGIGGARGLRNYSLSCFVNAVLQLVGHTPKVLNLLAAGELPPLFPHKSLFQAKIQVMTYTALETIKKMWKVRVRQALECTCCKCLQPRAQVVADTLCAGRLATPAVRAERCGGA